MYIPKGFYTKKNSRFIKENVSKALVVLFLFMLFCFGFDLGFSKYLNKKFQPIAKLLSVFSSLFSTAILFIPIIYVQSVFDYFWYSVMVIQNLLNFFVLYRTKYNVYDLISDLFKIIADVPELKSEFLGLSSFAYVFLTYSGQYIIGCIRCSTNIDEGDNECGTTFETVAYPIYGAASFGNHIINVTFILIFYYIFCYVRKIKTMAQASLVTQRKIQMYYLSVTECYDKIKPLYNKLLTVELLCEVPCIMGMVYHMLYYIHLEKVWIAYVTEALFSAPICLHILIPAIVKEMLNSQVEDLKLVLNKKILIEKDEEVVKEIQKTLQFVCAHPMHHNAWGFIPVDLRLPLGIFSLCVSYLIVIIQFTHILDN